MPSGPVVGLADAKTFLNITGTGDDAELGGFLTDAIAAVEDLIGSVTSESVTEVIDSHGPRIVLSRTPVVSVTSVSIQPWLGAAPIDDTAAWLVNPTTGVLRRVIVGGAFPWLGAGSVFTISYVVGRPVVPAPVNRAILMQVAEMWRSQRGAAPLPAGQMDAAEPSYPGGLGFLDESVMELLIPYLLPPGVA